MPAQTVLGAGSTYYSEYDTAPDLTRCLLDGAGNPIDLSGATVTISIAWSSPHGDYYRSPRNRIVDQDPVEVDPDQINNTGFVAWTPGAQGTDTALTPPGQFNYIFNITYQDGSTQTIPANTYLPLVVRAPVGGRGFTNPPLTP